MSPSEPSPPPSPPQSRVDDNDYGLKQAEHERRAAADPYHDPSPCVCCCHDCEDLYIVGPEQ